MKRLPAVFVLAVVSLACIAGASSCLRLGSGKMGSDGTPPHSLKVIAKQRLASTPGVGEYVTAWSPDGEKLTYTAFRGVMGSDRVYVGVLTLKGGGINDSRPIFSDSPFKEFGGKWSPDGRRLAFISNRTGNYDIWTTTEQGSDLRQLTTDEADDVYPTWSPDGAKVAFLSTRSREIAIWTMNADGSEQRQVTAGGNGDWGTDWSPDGKRIVFGSSRVSAENKPASQYDSPLKNFFETVFVGGIASEHIWVVDLPSQLIARITPRHRSKELRYWHPTWSPDGTMIAYVSNQAGSADIWVMDADGSNQIQLTTESTYDIFPTWSPDGTQIAFSSALNEKGEADIWLLMLQRADG